MYLFNINNVIFQLFGYSISYVEFAGTLFGLFSVYFASRANILTWHTGILNELFFFILFFQIQLYPDMFLQVFFFVTTIWGWNNWRSAKLDMKISTLKKRGKILLFLIISVATLLSGTIFQNIHTILPHYFKIPASYPFADSFVMVTSIIATLLLAFKKIENWMLWIIVDIVCVVLYLIKGVLFLSIEYFIFLILASYGLYHWNKIKRND